MGCCCAKEADVVLPEDKNDPAPDGASSAGSENSADTTSPNAPAHAVVADGPQAPPPGWGGKPELEEEEYDYQAQTEASKAPGPRDIGDISGEHGYITGTRKDQEISGGVMDRIKDLEDAGLQTTKKMGRKMLTPRIITDVKETWDKEGNIKREMTHYIEEPDGTKRTEKETVYLAPGDLDPLAAAAE
mmetsp:Transcript_11349/g.32683  ORF Transcript_11349/g.32683 Transcript_11349/m.32683 type:complete len:188 (+) Transcript_11349:151-714(+)|eukprot:CAMPEP_0172368632 /NCGR_PEP_ID=MMETSP1060-20121228/28332_1 /TAXON_ID=37318 /ORGANISM="Pseudo-nitzschia pungens, Strain cf. cingulata" /LENGTH=187 /DNA_ID=CAMNT_0013093287 /DNA_START=51 /DNA_END=614 /DNA_ORIENTATION=+